MNATKNDLPPVADFVKTLLVVLLAEFSVCTALNAARQWTGLASGVFIATACEIAAFSVLAFCVANNLASVGLSAFNRDAPEFRPFADVATFVTASFTVVLLAVCASRGMTFNAAAAAICAVAIPVVILFAPGKLLVPERSPR